MAQKSERQRTARNTPTKRIVRPPVAPELSQRLKKPSLWERLSRYNEQFRFIFLVVVFLVFFVRVWGEAWFLQMQDGGQYRLAERALRQYSSPNRIAGKRGMIQDRNGLVLAQSVEVRSIYIDTSKVKNAIELANTLGTIVNIEPQKIYDKIVKFPRRNFCVAHKVNDAIAEKVLQAKLEGVSLDREFDRVYPAGHSAGQLLGFVGSEDKGLEGLENSLEKRLACQASEVVKCDTRGKRFYALLDGKESPHGEDIKLTIDSHIQYFAEEAVAKAVREEKARWGGAIVVDPRNGEILAWAQYPFFDPNNFRQAGSAKRNRLALDALEPGSTFKPLVMAAALTENKLNKATPINCENGRWKNKYGIIRDTSVRAVIPASKVIRYSSNIGMAKIGLILGWLKMSRYLRTLGFGQVNADLALIHQSGGIFRRINNDRDCMSTSFGQAISVTVLQMVQAYMAILNKGEKIPLKILLNTKERPGKQIFSAQAVKDVREMMCDVVEANDGTGKAARIPGVVVAGKTGTAQKADNRSSAYGAKRTASFVGFVPAENPRFLIYVTVDEPQRDKYGGIVAAPVFKEIAERSLAYSGGYNSPYAQRIVESAEETAQKVKRRRFLPARLDSPFESKEGSSIELMPRKKTVAEQVNRSRRLASTKIPNVRGKTLRSAVDLFARSGIVPIIHGEGPRVIRQKPEPGVAWTQTGQCELWLGD